MSAGKFALAVGIAAVLIVIGFAFGALIGFLLR